MYRISQIKLGLEDNKEDISSKISKKLKISEKDIEDITIIKESIDARNKKDIKLVYTVDFNCKKNLKLDKTKGLEMSQARDYVFPKKVLSDKERPIVVGFGPSGIFAALIFAQAGYKPIVLERGQDVDQRSCDVEKFWSEGILNTESNVQFGEGGAGTFSDGKLTTGIKDIRIFKVLQELNIHGAEDSILYKQKPHIGTDKLKNIIKSIRCEIENLGGEVRFGHRVDYPILEEKENGSFKVSALHVSNNDNSYEIPCSKVILAIGHSAKDTFTNFFDKGLELSQKPMSIGLRVEHPQKLIDESQYGDFRLARKLGAADYKLNCRVGDNRGAYTFCMCPGGVVIMSSSDEKTIVSNGMSYSQRDGKFANSAILVDVRISDYEDSHPMSGFKFQRKYEQAAYEINNSYELLECKWKDFESSNLYKVLPDFARSGISEAMINFGRKIRGFDGEEAVFKGIETRSSSPVRATRFDNYESNIIGLYPCGEGPGYAGGIMSAAVDGIKVAESVIEDRKVKEI